MKRQRYHVKGECQSHTLRKYFENKGCNVIEVNILCDGPEKKGKQKGPEYTRGMAFVFFSDELSEEKALDGMSNLLGFDQKLANGYFEIKQDDGARR